MNKNDLKNPLIQSGIILLVVFLLIAIVANSEPHGFLGSIAGLASGILFLIGLFVAIIVSIAIIIGLFLGAVSIYSMDKGRELTGSLTATISSLYERIRGSVATSAKSQASGRQHDTSIPTTSAGTQVTVLAETVVSLQKQVQEQQERLSSSTQLLADLDRAVGELGSAGELPILDTLEQNQRATAQRFEDLAVRVDELKGQLANMEQQLSAWRQEVEEELSDLREKVTLPDVVSGILSYLDKPEDRELLTSKAEEAVARGMTYAQIDEFFQASFSPEVCSVLSTHPRLTKDFIRSIKKKFE